MADTNSRKRTVSEDGDLPAHASFFEVADPTMEATHQAPSLVFSLLTSAVVMQALPRAFIKRFHKYLSHSLILEAPNGQTWRACLEADRQKQLRITDGWRDLADYMNVRSGDLLIFDLVSIGHFQVYIYEGEDMCEKITYTAKKINSSEKDRYIPRAPESVENAKQQRTEMMHVCKAYTCPNPAKGTYSMAVQKMESIPTHAGDNGTKSMELAITTKKEATQLYKVNTGPNNGNCTQSQEDVMHRIKGDVTSNRINGIESMKNLKTGNMQTCNTYRTIKHGNGDGLVENADMQKREIKYMCQAHDDGHNNGLCNAHGGPNNDIVPDLSSPGWHGQSRLNVAAKMHLTLKDFLKLCQHFHEETQEAFKKAIAFSSKNPFTIIVMIHSNVCHGFKLALPKPFAERYLSAEPEHVALIDADNRAWSVTWLGYNNSSASFSGGWKHFAIDHQLQCGDICIFEQANAKVLTTFKVHIFKVNTKDATAIQSTIPAKLSDLIAKGST